MSEVSNKVPRYLCTIIECCSQSYDLSWLFLVISKTRYSLKINWTGHWLHSVCKNRHSRNGLYDWLISFDNREVETLFNRGFRRVRFCTYKRTGWFYATSRLVALWAFMAIPAGAISSFVCAGLFPVSFVDNEQYQYLLSGILFLLANAINLLWPFSLVSTVVMAVSIIFDEFIATEVTHKWYDKHTGHVLRYDLANILCFHPCFAVHRA